MRLINIISKYPKKIRIITYISIFTVSPLCGFLIARTLGLAFSSYYPPLVGFVDYAILFIVLPIVASVVLELFYILTGQYPDQDL